MTFPQKSRFHMRNKFKEENIVLEEETRDTEAMFPIWSCHMRGRWTSEGSNQQEYFVTVQFAKLRHAQGRRLMEGGHLF